MMIKIAIGEKDLGHVDNREVEWGTLAGALTRHTQADSKGGKFFVGGHFSGNERREEHLLERTLLTFDADKVGGMSLDDIELALQMNIDDCSVVAYSTFNHTPADPRLRIVIPLSRGVTALEYRHLSKLVGAAMDIPLDECSYKANQLMYLPSCPDPSQAWSLYIAGEPLQVDAYLPSVVQVKRPEPDADDLEAMLAAQPLDISEAEVVSYLKAYPAAGLEYDDWLRVGQALHHQFEGKQHSWTLWDRWSKHSPKYDADDLRRRWKSFGRSSKSVTFASIIYRVKESGGLGAVAETDSTGATPFDALLAEAAAVSDRGSYQSLADRVRAMPGSLLADMDRAMLVEALHKGWPKSVGIGKVDVRKSLTPAKRSAGGLLAFAQDWVYVEVPCVFHHTELNYAIKREAFNMKYSNEQVVLLDGRQASVLVSESPDFVTVVDTMYWPGADPLFDYEGRAMLNTCRDDVVSPCEVLDADGQSVVDTFLRHAEILLPKQVERDMLLDWLAYIIQNPGKRINWAVCLQGAQGCGKSYFAYVMQLIMGNNARQVNTSDIMGRFTGWAVGSRLAIVEEIRISGDSKYAIIDRLKAFIANTMISVEQKGRDAVTAPNFTSYLMLTNHKDAVPVDEGDRRYGVLFSALQNKAHMLAAFGDTAAKADYFKRLFEVSARRVDALAYYLMHRAISAGFQAQGEAPMTSAKEQMQTLAVSPEWELIEDAISNHACPIINKVVVDITHLAAECLLAGDELPRGRAIGKIMSELGYTKCGTRVNINPKGNGGKYLKHTVWYTEGEVVNGQVLGNKTALAMVSDFHNDPDYIPF